MKNETRFAAGALLALFGALLIGCSSVPVGTPAAKPSAAATTGSAQTSGEVQMCVLMPLAEVQAKSPFQTPLSIQKAGVDPGMCEYRSADEESEHVGVLLETTEFSSADVANTSLTNARQAAVDAGLPVRDVSGLGDKGFASGVDEVGVHVVSGDRIIDANLKGEWPDTTDDAKVAAGTELIRTLLSRLP